MTISPPDALLGVQVPQIVHRPVDVVSLDAATEAIELAELLGMTPDDSQRFTLECALGEQADGRWSAFEVGDVQPRQNGKGDTIQIRELAGLFLFEERLLIHTAHEFATANEAFLRLVAVIEANDWCRDKVARIRFANGEQGVELKSGARLKYRARTGGAGRGFAGADLVVYDEAYALQAEHVAASLPTLSTSPNAQVWFASSAGLAQSTQLWVMRKRALSGGAGRLAYCEHTAEDVSLDGQGKVVSRPIDVSDRRLWALANPAAGTRISWDYLEAEFAAMPTEQFARERLGVFDPLPDDAGEPKLDADRWAATAVADGPPSGRVVFGFDVDLDAAHASVCVAAGTAGAPYLEQIEHKDGVGWLPARLVELVEKWDPLFVAYNAAGPALEQVGSIQVAFREAGLSLDVLVPLTAGEYRAACGALFSHVVEGSLRRPRVAQGPLDRAAGDASERPLAEGWVWHRRQATVPISPLVAGTVACHLLPVENRVDAAANVW